MEQKSIWRFYLRLACQHFTPCSKCQEAIEREVEEDIKNMKFQNGYQITEAIIFNILCKICSNAIVELIMRSNRIILGNRDYEPMFELQRTIKKETSDDTFYTA